MSGRYAQNLSKSYQKSFCHEGYIDEAIERFLSIFCLILSAATQNIESKVKMAAALASIAEPGCRKMSRSNTCTKLPFGHKIHPAPDMVREFQPKIIEQNFMRQQFYVTYWRSQFSGQVSAIEARDAAIFTKIKDKSGRCAQNLSKSYQESIRHEGYIDEAIERFLSIFCQILSAATKTRML